MKKLFKIMARVLNDLAWFLAGKAGMIEEEEMSDGHIVQSCTFREGK